MRARLNALRLGALASAALALAGCADGPPETAALLPTENFNVQVTSHPEQMALGQHLEGLSPNQKAAVGQFVSRWRDDGGGVVTVSAPALGPPGPARRMADAAADYVRKMGVPAELVRMAGYAPPTGGPDAPPILLAYDRFETQPLNCSGAWDNLVTTRSNRMFEHFGCAVTANVAAQVANPRDLLAPAVTMPADDGRRETVIDKYRKGEVTSTAEDKQASGKVSDTNQ